MDRVYYLELAKARLERAKELLEDARELFVRESYKSANNRAFYAMEKSIKGIGVHLAFSIIRAAWRMRIIV